MVWRTRCFNFFCRLAVLGACLWLAPGCETFNVQPGSTDAPSIVGRNDTVSYPFGGFAYPRSGPIEYPGDWGRAGVLELDAPLRTAVPVQGSGFGPSYYAFTVSVRVQGLRFLELQWGFANNRINVEKVAGPCDPRTGEVAREFMHATSLRETGVATIAAYDGEIDAKLANDQPVWWVTCEPGAPGEVIHGGPVRVDYNVAVLMPQSRFSDNKRGHLLIRSRPVAQGPVSEALRIEFVESPRIFAVAGDSVAWGQGLAFQHKWWWSVYDTARADDDDVTERLYVRAHSAAALNGGAVSLEARATRNCRVTRPTPQELPLRAESVQCQLLQISRPTCFVDESMLDRPGVVPTLICEQTNNTTVDALAAPLENQLGRAVEVAVNHGPRIDFLFLTGCINDVGAVPIHTNLIGGAAALTADIDNDCDIRNAVPDLREEFPNAHIAWLGYHRTWSERTEVLNPLRCPAVASLQALGMASIFPINVVMTAGTPGAVAAIAGRSGLFKTRSDQVLAESVAELDFSQPGRGSIRFVPLEFFGPEQAAYAPDSMIWELNCVDPALQTVDEVRTQRYADCQVAEDALTPEEILAGIDWLSVDLGAEAVAQGTRIFCQRAPFLHPNGEANELMGDLVIEALEDLL